MCDVIVLSVLISSESVLDETEERVRSAIHDLANGAGLGIRFDFDLSSEYNYRLLLQKLESLVVMSGRRPVTFEIVSAPDEFCICDALPRAPEIGDSKPARSAAERLTRFLPSLFRLQSVATIGAFLGPTWVAQTDAMNRCGIRDESKSNFVQRFSTGEYAHLTAVGVNGDATGGFFRIH